MKELKRLEVEEEKEEEAAGEEREGAGEEEGEKKKRRKKTEKEKREKRERKDKRKEEINTFPPSYLMKFWVIFGAMCGLGSGVTDWGTASGTTCDFVSHRNQKVELVINLSNQRCRFKAGREETCLRKK